MENNLYLAKLNKLKEFMADEQSSLDMWEENLQELEKKYVGVYLEEEEKKLNKWISESRIKIESYDHLIWEIENFLRQDADVTQAETTSDKVSAEILNDEPENFSDMSGATEGDR